MIACPNCGGNVKFNIAAQQMSCEYCNSLFDPYSFDNKTKDAEEVNDFEATVFTCPQCGGEILSTDEAAAGFCSFCGASTILYSRISIEHRPDYIIPFHITKDQCKQSYANLMKKAIYAPKELRDPQYIDSFRGIYMPYWAFHVTQHGYFRIPAEKETRRGDYIITDHVNLNGNVDAYYKGLSYDASSSFADNISEALAPYDVKTMQPFTPGFFSGFYADVADVDPNVYVSDAIDTADKNTISQIRKVPSFAPYTPKTSAGTSLNTNIAETHYAMFPVWFMSYRNKDRVAYATVNGQTGKVVADIPIDSKKYLIGSALFTVPLFLLFNLAFTLTPSAVMVICTILGIITLGIFSAELSAITKKDSNIDDRGMLAKNANTNNPETSAPKGIPAGLALGFTFIALLIIFIASIGLGFSSPLLGGIASLVCIAASIPSFIAKSKAPGSIKGAGIIVTDIGAVIVALVSLFKPVADWYYYGAAIIFLAAVFLALTDVFKAYNILSTRKLPQFNKQGGDDRA